jgi:hypothetical protein
LISSLNNLNEHSPSKYNESPEILIKKSEKASENEEEIKITMFDALHKKIDRQGFEYGSESKDHNLTPRYVANGKPEVVPSHRHYATGYHE